VAPLAVDPEAYFAAGSAVVAAGDGLNAAMTVLTTGFGANTGLDLAGEVFGLSYQSSAESVVTLAAAVINACRHNGAVVQLCASNYSHAEAASVLGGGAGVLQPPAEPVKIGAPGPPGTLGPGEPPPLLWAVVQSFVDGVWPNGDVAGLHAAAGCWRTFGAAAGGMQRALNASKTLIGSQQMPEGDAITQALSQMGDTTGKLGEQCGQMARTLDEFANQVAQAQNAIRDLLHQLESLGDLWHDVVSILDGDALDEIKRIARDVNGVLRNLGREARAFEQGITLLMQVADGLVVNMEKSMRGQFTHFLGDAVGNQVANVSEKFINGNEGFVKEAIKAVQGPADLNPGWFVVDPKGAAATWNSTLEDQFKPSLLNEILNPQEGGEANLQMWKSLLHLDDWGGSRPGMGQGELGFDVAASLIPGVGEAGAGARAAEGASEVADAAGTLGRAGQLGDVAATSGALSDISKTSAGLTKDLEGLKVDVPKADPLPSGRPVGPPVPKPFEAPVEPTPRSVDSAPPGTPAPHSPTAPGPGRPEPPVVPHEPARASAGGPREPVSVPAAPGEHQPASAAVQSPQEAPALASATSPAVAPHLPSGAPSAELSAPGGGGWHGPGDGGPPGGPHESPPHEGGPRGPGDGGPADGRPSGLPPDGGPPKTPPDGDSAHPPGDGSPPGGERQDPVHSHGPSGDGWHRLPDDPIDPHHGEPLPEHWDFDDDPADPSRIKEPVAKLITDTDAPFGRDAQGHAYTEQEYAERFNKIGHEGRHWINYPDNAGALPGTRVAYTDPEKFLRDYGSELDRIGDNKGKYLAIVDDGRAAPWEQRSLHVDSLHDPYNGYKFGDLPEGWTIEVSEVAPGLGQPGGSIQVRIFDADGKGQSIEKLVLRGVLRP
jgi:hypothetical protein